MMNIRVKNMVCDRCVKVVNETLARLGIHGCQVTMGEISCPVPLSSGTFASLESELAKEGFEVVHSREEVLVDKTRNAIIKFIRSTDQDSAGKLSDYLADSVNADYAYLSRLFSSIEGRTIERYFIIQKIEYVKELIGYGTYTLSEIADMTGYSSVAHLSRQFKEVTGITPTAYKESGATHRPIDLI